MKEYNFQPELPVEFKRFAESLPLDKDHPSLYAVSQIHVFENPVAASIIDYPHMGFNKSKELTLLGNEYFMMRLDLRSIWSAIHFRPYPDAVWVWLESHGCKITDNEYESFLVTDLGIYCLHFNMAHGEVTLRVYVRSMVNPMQIQDAIISLSCEEAALARYALNLMYHTLEKRGTEFDRKRMMNVGKLEQRIAEALKAHYDDELSYIRNIGT